MKKFKKIFFNKKFLKHNKEFLIPLKRNNLEDSLLYSNFSTYHLFNSYVVFKLCKYDILVDNFEHIFNVSKKIITPKIAFKLLENTIGKQFTAGSSFENLKEISNFYRDNGYNIIVNYMSEFDINIQNEEFYQSCFNAYLQTIQFGAEYPNYAIGIKYSCLIDFELFKKINNFQKIFDSIFFELLANNNNFFGCEEQVIDSFSCYFDKKDIQAAITLCKEFSLKYGDKGINSKLTDNLVHIPTLKKFLTAFNINDLANNSEICTKYKKLYTSEEISKIMKFLYKIDILCNESKVKNISLAVDAEQSYVQAAIRNISEQFQLKYNFSESNYTPTIINTFQNYLKETKKFLGLEIEFSNYYNIPMAIKMVRGAYLGEENKLKNVEPCETYDETNCNFNTNCISLILNSKKNSKFIIATHNNDSFEIVNNFIKKISNNNKLKNILNDNIYSNLSDSIFKRDNNFSDINNILIDKFKNIENDFSYGGYNEYKENVNFATLLGLNDTLAHTSKVEGYTTYKYMPFGKPEIMLPFLIRRAQETKSIIKHSTEQIDEIRAELIKRIFNN